MKKGSTIFLRLVVVVLGLGGLALCIFAVPSISKGVGAEFPSLAYWRYPILIGLYAAAIPFFLVLSEVFKLLNYIDTNKAFSNLSVTALKRIKFLAITEAVLFAGFMPLAFLVAQIDDAPGLILIFGSIFVGTPIVITVFAALLEKLLRNAIDMKAENDLMV